MSFRNLVAAYFISTVLVGWLALGLSSQNATMAIDSARGTAAAADALDKAFVLYALALGAFLVGVVGVSLWRPAVIVREARRDRRPLWLLTTYAALGIAGVLLTMGALDVVPLTSSDPGQAKHFLHRTGEFQAFKPLYLVSYTTLAVTATLTIGLLVDTGTRSRPGILAACGLLLSTIAVLALTAKRKAMFFPLYVTTVAAVLLGRVRWRALLATSLIIVAAGLSLEYVGDPSQPLVRNPIARLRNPDSLAFRFVNNFFVEPRELGRFLYQWDRQPRELLYGRSYVAALLGFLPSSAVSFKERHDIGRVTLRTLGYPPNRGAVPRIGYVGEAYVNFGAAGVVVVSLLFGALVETVSRFFVACRRAGVGMAATMIAYMVLGDLVLGLFGSGSSQFAFTGLTVLLVAPFWTIRPVHVTWAGRERPGAAGAAGSGAGTASTPDARGQRRVA